MLRCGKDALYLEPGEIAVLANLARQAVPPGPPTHPNALLLAVLAERLAEMAGGPGVVVSPAPAPVVRQAAEAYVHSGHAAAVSGHQGAPSTSIRSA
jgi:hypothetical protein